MFILCVILSVLLAAAALASAAAKLTKQPRVIESIGGTGVPLRLFGGLATLEILGALGVLIGLAVPSLGIAAGTGLALYFLGAIIAHVRVKDGPQAYGPPFVLMLLAIAVVVTRAASM